MNLLEIASILESGQNLTHEQEAFMIASLFRRTLVFSCIVTGDAGNDELRIEFEPIRGIDDHCSNLGRWKSYPYWASQSTDTALNSVVAKLNFQVKLEGPYVNGFWGCWAWRETPMRREARFATAPLAASAIMASVVKFFILEI